MRVSFMGMSVELVDTAGDWWKMYSSWIFGFISVMGLVQAVVPFVSWALPNWILGVVWTLIGLAGILARLVKQFNLTPAPETK
jgi:hypothetical protein